MDLILAVKADWLGDFFRYIAEGTAVTIAVTLVALPLGLVPGLFLAAALFTWWSFSL